ncbi:MAG: hypothetical protein ACLPH3_16150 [Terracidiphilus sp.]
MNAVATRVAAILFATAVIFAQAPKQKDTPAVSVVGYFRDSGCVHRFHEVVKPLPNGCVEACVRGGSPLVVLTKDEHVYHPISAEMPDVDLRPRLLPFVGKLVKITGRVYTRGGSDAISLEQIEEVKE